MNKDLFFYIVKKADIQRQIIYYISNNTHRRIHTTRNSITTHNYA